MKFAGVTNRWLKIISFFGINEIWSWKNYQISQNIIIMIILYQSLGEKNPIIIMV